MTDELMEWWDALRAEGIVPDETRRAIIDIDWARGTVLVYYESFADKRMFSVDLLAALKGVEVISVKDKE